jgi:hypothetical protein
LTTVRRILVTHLSQFLDIDWPPIVLEAFNVFKPLTFSLDFARPECSVDITPQQKLYGVLFVPVGCCIGVALVNFIVAMFSLLRLHFNIRKMTPSHLQSQFSFGFRAILHCLLISSFGRKLKREAIAEFGQLYYGLNPLLFVRADWNVGVIAARTRRNATSINVLNGSNNKRHPPVSSKDDAYPEQWVLTRKFFEDSNISARFMSNVLGMKKSASGALSVLILSFVGVIETALPILNCFEQITADGSKKFFLRSDRSIECSVTNSLYQSLVSMAVIGLALYAFILPLAMQIVFRSQWCRRFYRLDYASYQIVFGFVTSRYKREFVYWELLVYMKKSCQIAIPLYLANRPVQQSVLLFLAMCVYSVLVLYTMPYSSQFLNTMELLSSMDIVVTVAVGIFFVVDYKGIPIMSEDTKKVFGILLVALCGATLAASVWCIFREMRFLLLLHKQKMVSAWLKLSRGVSGDSVQESSLFLLFCSCIYNAHSSKAIIAQTKLLHSSIDTLRQGCCQRLLFCWFWLKSWFAVMSYEPAPKVVLPFLRHPVIEILRDLHHIIQRISQLRSVGIHTPKEKLDLRMLETHGAGDPPYEVYQQIAEIDGALRDALSDESCRYLLAILVADKFRDNDRENVFTKRYWDRIIPRSGDLVNAIARVQHTSKRLRILKPVQKSFFRRLYAHFWPDHAESYSMFSVIQSFNEMSHTEYIHFVDDDVTECDDDDAVTAAADDDGGGDGDRDGGLHNRRHHSNQRYDDNEGTSVKNLREGSPAIADRRRVRAANNHLPRAHPIDAPDKQPSAKTALKSAGRQIRQEPRKLPVAVASGLRASVEMTELTSSDGSDNEFHTSTASIPIEDGDDISNDSCLMSISNDIDHNAHSSSLVPGGAQVVDASEQFQSHSRSSVKHQSAVSHEMPEAAVAKDVESDSDSNAKISPLQPPRASNSSAAPIKASAAPKAVPSKATSDRYPQSVVPPLPPVSNSAGGPHTSESPPHARNVFGSTSLQRTNALNQPLPSRFQSQSLHGRIVNGSTNAHPRHIVLASAIEREQAVAVDIPAGDDHKKAAFVFDWPAPAHPPPIAPESRTTGSAAAALPGPNGGSGTAAVFQSSVQPRVGTSKRSGSQRYGLA